MKKENVAKGEQKRENNIAAGGLLKRVMDREPWECYEIRRRGHIYDILLDNLNKGIVNLI